MKILLCHTYYQQQGGEDLSFEAEVRLLEANGHQVLRYTLHNRTIDDMSRLEVARKTLWNSSTYREVRDLIRTHRPEVMHCTNTFPLLSPSIYYAAQAEGVAVVQSLRNYRLTCLNALLQRQGRVCEDCLGRSVAWSGLRHRCYRGSLAGSMVLAGMLSWHRLMGTWKHAVDLYFTPSAFARDKLIETGIDPNQIAVKPNFLDPDPGQGPSGPAAIFVGRLDEGKGLPTLLRAWQLATDAPALRIVGDGPLAGLVREAALQDSRIEWLGRVESAQVLQLIGNSACLIMPSTWYETFGRTILEAFACGIPVIASRLGAMSELVEDNVTGLLFQPDNPADLVLALRRLLTDTTAHQRMCQAARLTYLSRYTSASNYPQLLAIYQQALKRRQIRSNPGKLPGAPVAASPG